MDTRLLAIETATKSCSIALMQGDELLGESSLYVPHVHVERLVVMINNMFSDLRLRQADLDAIGVSIGPGSFTGLRIGLSVAKGIAFALNKKIISVPTLDAIAYAVAGFADGRVVVPLLHARGDEFYYATYTSESCVAGHCRVAQADSIVEEFGPGTLFVGEGVPKFEAYESVQGKFGEKSFVELQASARNVAVLAMEKYERGDFADLQSAVPLYVKDFVAIKGNPLNKLVEKA
ncbi:MAG: tRNA (adenosine(37)-N6)-threonylcarbamoyltransferase complex dimerization subunit type 1 TsaB [Bacteroidetes bacterium]|nr:tRNA (adenosine(37)-N6)-threonylcarbamoyltransferase complex dimerization subunit type 1 TsaB [Bacteroidota bacterium]MCL5034151.1 tRNA (adenosine(37)-N6)-threonylcarbamoyltransferase complex dimerization subunit type 1 TsaB [Bacteroidota bacterium]